MAGGTVYTAKWLPRIHKGKSNESSCHWWVALFQFEVSQDKVHSTVVCTTSKHALIVVNVYLRASEHMFIHSKNLNRQGIVY